MRPRYTRAADEDLRAIYRTSVRLFGVVQAESYVAMLNRACRLIGEYPRSAPLRHGITPAVRVRSVQSHVVIYEVDEDDAALILRVRHAREDWINDPING